MQLNLEQGHPRYFTKFPTIERKRESIYLSKLDIYSFANFLKLKSTG